MLTLIIIILAAAFVLYTLLGGADFGAGIVETFAGRKGEHTISKAIAPVWEANHVWLILAVVILFTGFPSVYSSISLALHIPLMLVLIGIICRGSAFTFRHYDVKQGRTTHRLYSFLFKASSFITPFFLGITLGAMILGRITFEQSVGFYHVFVAPWFNVFCFFVGVFSTSLFTYIAAVFLVGEAKDKHEAATYVTLAKRALAISIATGILVFISASFEGHDLLSEFIQSRVSIFSFIIVTLLIIPILYFLEKSSRNFLRFTVGVQVTAVLIGWFAIQYPVLVQVQDGRHLTFFNTQAPEATLQQLLIALLIGLVLVIPAFIFLFKVFKTEEKQEGV